MTKKSQKQTQKTTGHADEPKEGKREQGDEELLAQLQRLQAEFENYKRRTAQEQERLRDWGRDDVLTSLLPLLDNFELALANAAESEKDGFYKGMELIYAQLKDVLTEHGVREITTERFDPTKHEAMLAEESDLEKGSILEVLQKGYERDGKVLRTAKVKVAK